MREINLRPWQAEAKNKCISWFENKNRRFVINAAPGAGKTICASVRPAAHSAGVYLPKP